MKVTINTTAPQSREIDWSKPMVVLNGVQCIQTTGEHTGKVFAGMDIYNSRFSYHWIKSNFTPCTTPITVTFENEL